MAIYVENKMLAIGFLNYIYVCMCMYTERERAFHILYKKPGFINKILLT